MWETQLVSDLQSRSFMCSVNSIFGSPFTEYWDVIDLVVPVEVLVEDKFTVFLGSAMGSSIVCIAVFSLRH